LTSVGEALSPCRRIRAGPLPVCKPPKCPPVLRGCFVFLGGRSSVLLFSPCFFFPPLPLFPALAPFRLLSRQTSMGHPVSSPPESPPRRGWSGRIGLSTWLGRRLLNRACSSSLRDCFSDFARRCSPFRRPLQAWQCNMSTRPCLVSSPFDFWLSNFTPKLCGLLQRLRRHLPESFVDRCLVFSSKRTGVFAFSVPARLPGLALANPRPPLTVLDIFYGGKAPHRPGFSFASCTKGF